MQTLWKYADKKRTPGISRFLSRYRSITRSLLEMVKPSRECFWYVDHELELTSTITYIRSIVNQDTGSRSCIYFGGFTPFTFSPTKTFRLDAWFRSAIKPKIDPRDAIYTFFRAYRIAFYVAFVIPLIVFYFCWQSVKVYSA